MTRRVVFDIETQELIGEDGKYKPEELSISVLGLYDSETDSYRAFLEEDFSKLWPIIEHADVLVGYNSDSFDIPLLNKYYSGDLTKVYSLDILKEIRSVIGRRISLSNVAQATLGYGKSGSDIDAPKWWKAGEIEKIKKYCLQDVKVTKELYEYMLNKKHFMYRDGTNTRDVEINTDRWEATDGNAMTHTLGF